MPKHPTPKDSADEPELVDVVVDERSNSRVEMYGAVVEPGHPTSVTDNVAKKLCALRDQHGAPLVRRAGS